MTKQQYEKWAKTFEEHPERIRMTIAVNKILTLFGYVGFVILIGIEWIQDNPLWIRSVLVSGIAFLLVTWYRKVYNKQRPYEAFQILPAIQKETKGKSFPSRHVFSMFMVAMCWLVYNPVVGVVYLLAGIGMAWIRVIGGVHYPVDVVAGAAIGILSGIVGFWLL